MLLSYWILFSCICALLPLSAEAPESRKCRPNRRTNAVTQRALNGSDLCATSPPTETLTADAKILCLHACLRRTSCEDGLNYRSDSKLCQLYLDQPTSYQVQSNCIYLKV